MSEYQKPIRISTADPICSATALNGTVIGILFEKTGAQIKEAINNRTLLIDKKIEEYEGTIKNTDEFLKAKTKEIEELDRLYTGRSDEKKAMILPMQREIEEIYKKINDSTFNFDRDTEKQVAEKAVTFEESFEGLGDRFKAIDELLIREEANIGIGRTGSTGPCGMIGPVRKSKDYSQVLSDTTDGMTYYAAASPELKSLSKKEDKALARLNTLKGMVTDYLMKVQSIQSEIEGLKEEKRRLTLIQRHIIDDRFYKLDLNKLSAFGFEAVELG